MTRAVHRGIRFLAALQVLLVLVLVFGDIGFDKPGRFGLAFGSLLLCGGALVAASLVGLVWSARRRALGAALAHLLLPFVVLGGLYAREAWRDRSSFVVLEAAELQHLVGKSLAEVESELGDLPGITQATYVEAGGERVELQCPGVTVRFSTAGVATEVVENDR